MAAKLRSGDKVVVLAGKEKGKEGTISSIDPKAGKAVIDGQVILRPVIANSSVSKKSLQGFIEECLTCLKTVQDGEMLIQ